MLDAGETVLYILWELAFAIAPNELLLKAKSGSDFEVSLIDQLHLRYEFARSLPQHSHPRPTLGQKRMSGVEARVAANINVS